MAKKKKDNKENKKTKKRVSNSLASFYKKYYKVLLIIPLILFVISTYFIYNTILEDGTPIYRGISLKGGVSITIYSDSKLSVVDLEEKLKEKFPNGEFSVSELVEEGKRVGFIIDSNVDEKNLKPALEEILDTKFNDNNYFSNYISPTLSNAFFLQVSKILIISFVLMSIVIFLYFKDFMPSFVVILSGFFDLYVTVGFLDMIGYKLSIAGMGALLMLIGYSIDTDILLTNRLIKEEGKNYFSKVFDAFKTGLTMSLTTLIASLVAYFFSTSVVIKEITFIIIVGLSVDLISTWIQNSGLLLWKLNK